MWELPDVVFGLTSFDPLVSDVGSPVTVAGSGSRRVGDSTLPAEKKDEVQHIERVQSTQSAQSQSGGDKLRSSVKVRDGGVDVGARMRPARWRKNRQGQWQIEGLGGLT